MIDFSRYIIQTHRQRFTFLELLMAMAVLVVVALLALKFFSNMQNVWEASLSAGNAHADARLALELMDSDLSMALAREDDQPGRDIMFHQPSSSSVWFVTVAYEDTTGDCALVEVAYRLNGTELQRAFVDESCSAWNIYGARDDADDQGGYRTIVDNVIDCDITCYDESLTSEIPDQSPSLPSMISLSLTVLDNQHIKRWRSMTSDERINFEKQFARTFWKTIRLR